MSGIKEWFQETLFDWVYVLLYDLLKGLLKIVKLVESFFDIFAGTAKVTYEGTPEFLINIFFSNSAVTNAFWGMTLIAVVLAFGFCIYSVSRKITDVTGSVQKSLGQIFSSFFRSMLTLLLLNAIMVASLNISNVLLDRINYVMLNASILDQEDGDREFTDTEYAVMARVLATVGNYSVNPSSTSRYNINSCFNAIRGDLYSLQSSGVFDYEYELDSNGDHCWQSALALLASSADLTTELSLDEYDAEVADAFETVVYQLNYNPGFAPVQYVSTVHSFSATEIKTDVLIFLVTGMEAANNAQYNTGNIYDTIRIGYLNGTKDYTNMTQVRKDFDIWEMDYLVGYIISAVFVLIMAICIFNLIVRIFNLMLLYITAPLFVSSMPVDEGEKFKSWTQAFIIQMFSGFGMVIAMRLYLIMVPIIMSSDLVFFSGDGMWYSFLNIMARMLMVLGGAWAVLKSSSLVSGILAGNPGMAALQQEGQTSSLVTRGAKAALHDTAKLTMGLGKAVLKSPQAIATAPAKAVNAVREWGHGFTDPYHAIGDGHRQRKAQRADRAAAKQDAWNKAKEKWGLTGSDNATGSDGGSGGVPQRNRGEKLAAPAQTAPESKPASPPPAPPPPFPPPPTPPPLPPKDAPKASQPKAPGTGHSATAVKSDSAPPPSPPTPPPLPQDMQSTMPDSPGSQDNGSKK